VAEVNTKIHKVLDLGANPSPGASPTSLHEGVASNRVSMFGPISVAYVILFFHHAHILAQRIGGACSEPWDANLPEDVARQEEKHASNKKVWARKERKQARSATREVVKEWGQIPSLNLGLLARQKRRG
jgi:hypothetical protein